jgi:hypothetical protein
MLRVSLPVALILTLAQQLPGQDAVRCKVRCTRQPAQFRMGEAIEVELAFTASIPNRYVLDPAWRDYQSRPQQAPATDVHWEFAIEPRANTHDPLQLFLESPFGSPPRVTEISDTSYRPTMLTPSPTLVRVVLNQWVAFDQPGKYRLRVAHVPYSDQTAGTPAEVSSNPIELEILPSDEAWQNAELQRLLRKLTDAEAAGAVADFAPAASGLRYLGTEEAAREMARRIRNGNLSADGEFADGLITSPNWRAGLQEMRRLVRDPDFPIPHYNFTDTLAILESAARRESSRRPISANELMTDAMAAVIAALPLKAEKAGMVTDDTVRTAISFAGTGARQALTAELLRVFESLSQSRQMGYLNDSAWESVGSAQWARVLGRVAAKYRIPAGQPGNDETVELLLATLRHWYEVDPANARPAILQEMVRPRPLYSAQEIGVLPDRTLPDQEKELLGHLLDSGPLPEDIKANILSLLGRYGTGARLEEVIRREAPPAGTAPCHIQPEFLAHVLKADAKSARPLLERAMACKATGPPQGRNFGIFTELILSQEGEFPARELHLPAAAMAVLEELAVRNLRDDDATAVADAAGYLERHGSAAAERPLWERYQAWHDRWVGRAPELDSSPQKTLGAALAGALARGLAWLTDRAKLQQLAALAVGKDAADQVRYALDRWQESPAIRAFFSVPPYDFGVVQYERLSVDQLKRKLAQFPPGTVFQWHAERAPVALYREVKAAAAKQRISVVRNEKMLVYE